MKHFILFVMTLFLINCGSIQKFDTLVQKNQICEQKFADYEAALQRRSDLIPNLVSVVKGAAAHENKTLTEVMEARSKATQIQLSADDLSDPEKVQAFTEAQAALKGSLSRLMAVQEAYPDLKANKNFENLMVQLEGTENRILRSREEYNKAVMDYNTELDRVGGRVVNGATGKEFKPRVYFKAAAGADKAPEINL